MSEKSLSERFLPLLGAALIILLVLAGTSEFLAWRASDSAARAAQSNQGQAVLAQRVAAAAGAAARHDTDAFAELSEAASALAQLQPVPGEPAAVSGPREAVRQHLAALVETRGALEQVDAAADRVDELVGQLLEQMAELMGMLPAARRSELAPHLDRFDLTAKGLRQDMGALVGGFGTIGLVVDRLTGGEDYMSQLVRGMSGEDTALGVPAVEAAPATGQLARIRDVSAALGAEIRTAVGTADRLVFMQSRAAQLQDAARQWFAALPPPGSAGSAATLTALMAPVLLALALVAALAMVALHRGAADAQRLAKSQAAQNERNQQAILRLLDELGSLADGDLTVEATVTEDITGAIADSINFAVEALRDLVATIEGSAIQIDAAARQTKASAAHLATASGNQSRHVASATESIANIAKQIEEVSGDAERSADVARHSVDVAHKGGEAVRRTIDGMNTIRETIQETSKRIKRLGESSQEIGNIVELINDIADQTNILALNASIQASMAGEAGRGFAVVADEVQRLAEKSANATKQIEVLVRTIQADTNEAVVSMEQSTTDVVSGATLAENAGASLDEIEKVSNQIASLVQNISNTARQQATAAAGMTRNMAVLQEISAQTAESTGATSNAIGKLAQLAGGLRKSVAGFTLPDRKGGGKLSAPTAANTPERTVEMPTPPSEVIDIGEGPDGADGADGTPQVNAGAA